ncbi:uncharacterized protein CEXT_306311 [Caerostris extrusa]|uniref:Site-specific DNA endonuclease n=1 Tax=Caerostris extrusa TaxID=172846 RepID=A0AAV4TDY5_CAEEX|nr:uncharacterized protein CEXT_306311 [Caerostris extrusa]
MVTTSAIRCSFHTCIQLTLIRRPAKNATGDLNKDTNATSSTSSLPNFHCCTQKRKGVSTPCTRRAFKWPSTKTSVKKDTETSKETSQRYEYRKVSPTIGHQRTLQRHFSRHSKDFAGVFRPCPPSEVSSLTVQKVTYTREHYLVDNSEEKLKKRRKRKPMNKKMNTEEIIASDFRLYFSYYAKRGGRLYSGTVISKCNSNYWLKRTGVVSSEKDLTTAEASFSEVARRKLVLNIYDYMQFLTSLAKKKKTCFIDLVKRLKSVGISDDYEWKPSFTSEIAKASIPTGYSCLQCQKQKPEQTQKPSRGKRPKIPHSSTTTVRVQA